MSHTGHSECHTQGTVSVTHRAPGVSHTGHSECHTQGTVSVIQDTVSVTQDTVSVAHRTQSVSHTGHSECHTQDTVSVTQRAQSVNRAQRVPHMRAIIVTDREISQEIPSMIRITQCTSSSIILHIIMINSIHINASSHSLNTR